jgi:tripartite-type tricarboxylate transporter receptor subunit TctC
MVLSGASAVHAQGYPTKSIRIVVPFAPGGNVDINARSVAPGLTEFLGQPVVVDNRAGAGGMIGSELVVKGPADGYTLLMASNSVYSVAPSLFPKCPYHPVRDFAPVSTITSVPFVLIVHPSVPARNVKEFVALAKANASKMSFASAGVGTTNHLVAELFQMRVGTRLVAVPYKGSGPALIDLMGGQVDVHVDQMTSSMGYIRSGKVRAIGVTTEKRSAMLPDIATLAEQGLKGFDATTLTGIVAPAATPKEVVDRLHAALQKVLAQPAVRDRFASLGADTIGSTPAEFAAYIKEDFAKWSKVVKDANIKVD